MGENNTTTVSEMQLLVVYSEFFIMLLVMVIFGVSCGLVIRVLVKETELHTKC